MNNQILAHLSLRLSKQHELIATEGLAYLLQRSELCRRAIEQIAASVGCSISNIEIYKSESVGENLERPDIVGFSSDGNEPVIIEGKFDAGLTDNQPNNYLARLPRSAPGILAFVVPDRRIKGLWRAVYGHASSSYELANERQLPDGSMCADIGPHHRLVMMSWQGILNQFLLPSQRASHPLTNDILQLMSLCIQIEGESFKPFCSEELTSTLLARRHRDFCDIADAVTGNLVSQGLASTTGLKATPQRDGYSRYLILGQDYSKGGVAIRLDYTTWMENEISPLWLVSVKETTAILRPVFRDMERDVGLPSIDKGSNVMLSLPIEAGLEFNEIVHAVTRCVEKVISKMLEHKTNYGTSTPGSDQLPE